MTLSLRNSALALALIGGAALASAPALANDFSEEGNFGGTRSYIGPGAAYEPPAYFDVGPVYDAPIYGPRVYVEPGYGPPVRGYYDY
jgi:hypothetical protein